MSDIESGASPSASLHKLDYTGTVGQLLPIVIVNFLLNVITLTIYRFWARTRVRHYLWSHTRLDDEPLEYTGKGSEIFIGFILVMFLFFVPLAIGFYFAIAVLGESNPGLSALLVFAVYILIFYLYGFAIYSARRYRLSRTQWRGIRMTQTGSAYAYAAKMLGYTVLMGITLGWIQPVMDMRLWSYAMNNTWFGDEKFNFKEDIGSLYGPYAIAWFSSLGVFILWFVLLILTLMPFFDNGSGTAPANEAAVIAIFLILYVVLIVAMVIPWAWYYARFFSLAWSGTTIQNAQLGLRISAGALIGFSIGNLLILFFTLGLGFPFVQQRIFRFFITRTDIEGRIEFDSIGQSKEYVPRFGEGLAESFDLGTV